MCNCKHCQMPLQNPTSKRILFYLTVFLFNKVHKLKQCTLTWFLLSKPKLKIKQTMITLQVPKHLFIHEWLHHFAWCKKQWDGAEILDQTSRMGTHGDWHNNPVFSASWVASQVWDGVANIYQSNPLFLMESFEKWQWNIVISWRASCFFPLHNPLSTSFFKNLG